MRAPGMPAGEVVWAGGNGSTAHHDEDVCTVESELPRWRAIAPADTSTQRAGARRHCARHQSLVTLGGPRCAGRCSAAVELPGGSAVRLRGQQSNTALMVIALVLIVALLVAGYVLLIAPR